MLFLMVNSIIKRLFVGLRRRRSSPLLRQMRKRDDAAHRQQQHGRDISLLYLLDQCAAGQDRLRRPHDPDEQAGPYCRKPSRRPLASAKRLETIFASVIDRRLERTERRREHLAELHRRLTEIDQRRGRLYDAIESGMVDKDDVVARERMAGLKVVRIRPWPMRSQRMPRSLRQSGRQP